MLHLKFMSEGVSMNLQKLSLVLLTFVYAIQATNGDTVEKLHQKKNGQQTPEKIGNLERKSRKRKAQEPVFDIKNSKTLFFVGYLAVGAAFIGLARKLSTKATKEMLDEHLDDKSWKGLEIGKSIYPRISKMTGALGTNPTDIGSIIGLAATSMSFASMCKEDEAAMFRRFAIRAPCVALVFCAVRSKSFRDVAQHVMGLGEFFANATDENPLTAGVLCTGFYLLIDPLLTYLTKLTYYKMGWKYNVLDNSDDDDYDDHTNE